MHMERLSRAEFSLKLRVHLEVEKCLTKDFERSGTHSSWQERKDDFKCTHPSSRLGFRLRLGRGDVVDAST